MNFKFPEQLIPTKETQRIAKRFAVEFTAPFLIALAWTLWDWKKSTGGYDALSKGAVHFFAAGWAFSQWNRIKKQKNSEDGLNNVQRYIESLIKKLDVSTRNLLGSATGGDSFCEIRPTKLTPLFPSDFELIHHGDYPLYDLQVRIVDLARYVSAPRSTSEHENLYEFGMLPPKHAMKVKLNTPDEEIRKLPRRLNIFVTARNGSFTQLLQIDSVNGLQQSASQIIRNEEIIWMAVDRDFPKNGVERVDWSVHNEDSKFHYRRDIF